VAQERDPGGRPPHVRGPVGQESAAAGQRPPPRQLARRHGRAHRPSLLLELLDEGGHLRATAARRAAPGTPAGAARAAAATAHAARAAAMGVAPTAARSWRAAGPVDAALRHGRILHRGGAAARLPRAARRTACGRLRRLAAAVVARERRDARRLRLDGAASQLPSRRRPAGIGAAGRLDLLPALVLWADPHRRWFPQCAARIARTRCGSAVPAADGATGRRALALAARQ